MKLLALFLGKLLSGASNSENKSDLIRNRIRTEHDIGGGYYWTGKQVSNGFGGYCRSEVCLLNRNDRSFYRCIVNSDGKVVGNPGFEKGEWTDDLEFPLDGRVRFSFDIGQFCDGKAPVTWTLQPDGRYFEDEDGFGAENCEEICVRSYIDSTGKFTEPFKYIV